MKNILSLVLIISCFALYSSCQKEISEENGNGLENAQGSLWDTLGNCLPDSVHGTFYNGITPGSDTCFVEIQVNVTQTGSYNISTDLQNGFQFVDSGFFNATGINIIRLKPIGTPIIPVTTVFSVSFDTSACSFVVDVKDSTGTGLGQSSAKGTLKDSLGNCLPDSVHGTYYNGITPGIDTCFVEIQVNVTQTGPYNISTDIQNGFQFADAGVFNITGINTIKLKPVGTPILPIATNFTVSFDGSVCSFPVDVKDSTGGGLGGGGGDTTQAALGMWKLYDSSNAKEYTGQAIAADTLIAGVSVLAIQGAVSTLDTILFIQLVITDTALENVVPAVIQTGMQNSFKFSYLNGTTLTDLYVADATTVGVMTINLNTYDSVTRVLKGRFSGTVNDAVNGGTVSVTDGSFTVVIP